MTTTLQNEGIITLYHELAAKALNPEDLEPWVSLDPPAGKVPKTTLEIGSIFFDLALWAKSAQPHHLTPAMRPEEFAALKEGIRLFGLVDGVVYINQRGIVVDGYHRLMAILERLQEGATLAAPEVRFIQFHRSQDELALVLMMNVNRRMLDDDQKEEVLKNLLRSGHDGTDNWLSRLCGLSPDKTSDVRAMLENLPIEEGGIEFQNTRRSEAGKSYKQKKRKPESEKRRARVGLTTDAKKPQAMDLPQKMKDSTFQTSNDTEIKPANPEQELDAVPDVEFGVEMLPDDDADENADLVLLIRSWWQAYHFLPVLSRELAALGKDTPPSKGEADAITRRLKPLVGTELGGYLVLYKKMSAGVAAFLLYPVAFFNANDIDKELLTRNAGSV